VFRYPTVTGQLIKRPFLQSKDWHYNRADLIFSSIFIYGVYEPFVSTPNAQLRRLGATAAKAEIFNSGSSECLFFAFFSHQPRYQT
jgi:hypothetical protein